MDIKEMRKLTKEDLAKEIKAWKQERVGLFLGAGLKKNVDKPHKLNLLKKQIARGKTVLTEARK